ncbi:MAG: hypothetical protein JW841_02555 [Deltaproteobacteria bacterium]|nr:hypothetical protein [Deltaproteobacteria bacterium]
MQWTSYNRCNLPPWVIASREFNENPSSLEIQGGLHSNAFLFKLLDEIPDSKQRAERFDAWVSVRF